MASAVFVPSSVCALVIHIGQPIQSDLLFIEWNIRCKEEGKKEKNMTKSNRDKV